MRKLNKLAFWRKNRQEVDPRVQQEIDDFMTRRPYDPVQKGYVPATAGEKSVALAATVVVAFFAGVFAVLYFWVFPFMT